MHIPHWYTSYTSTLLHIYKRTRGPPVRLYNVYKCTRSHVYPFTPVRLYTCTSVPVHNVHTVHTCTPFTRVPVDTCTRLHVYTFTRLHVYTFTRLHVSEGRTTMCEDAKLARFVEQGRVNDRRVRWHFDLFVWRRCQFFFFLFTSKSIRCLTTPLRPTVSPVKWRKLRHM